ncbi:MAG TPA: DUF3313 family protein [Burkholderiales bacterium]|nr:DUF3313 family protein [Burkholderiales bacterium]
MRALFVLAVLLAIVGCAAQPTVTSDGLVSERSAKFEELYLRPGADLSAYRRALIEPVPVKFAKDYLARQHGLNHLLAQPMGKPYQDPDAVAQDLAALMQASLRDAFAAAHYEIAGESGPGVLRISARIDELYINAPDELSSSIRAAANRDTGQATLSLEAADSTTGQVLARVMHRTIVREATGANLADDTTNRFWLETAFRRWAKNVTTEFGAGRRMQVSLGNQP